MTVTAEFEGWVTPSGIFCLHLKHWAIKTDDKEMTKVAAKHQLAIQKETTGNSALSGLSSAFTVSVELLVNSDIKSDRCR